MKKWVEEAKTAIKADAECAFAMCQDTATKHDVTPEWVVETFHKEFLAIMKKEGITNA